MALSGVGSNAVRSAPAAPANEVDPSAGEPEFDVTGFESVPELMGESTFDFREASNATSLMIPLLDGRRLPESSVGIEGSTVLTDSWSALDVPDEKTKAEADKQLQDNEARVQSALKDLPADKAQIYERLKGLTASDPIASLSLQRLLFQGSGVRVAADGKTGLEHLGRMLDAPMPPGMNRGEYVRCALREAAEPSVIDQGGRGTCGASSLAGVLAEANPIEYLRLAADLAVEGHCQLAGGGLAVRPVQTAPMDRSPVQQLMAPSLMGSVAPPGSVYLDADDAFLSTRDGRVVQEGLNPEQSQQLMKSMFGGTVRRLEKTESNREELKTLLSGRVHGQPMVASLRGADGDFSHAVAVKFVSPPEEGLPAQIHFRNPWGVEEAKDLEGFVDQLIGVNYREATSEAV